MISSAQTFQNLVPNGSFETYTQCPSIGGQAFAAVPWTAPVCNSSDYFNACSSQYNVPSYAGVGNPYYYLVAKDGNAYEGIFLCKEPGYREYLQVKLTDTLKAGKCYYVEFFAVSGQLTKYNANNAAASLSSGSNAIVTSTVTNGGCSQLTLTPHIVRYGNPVIKDTINWQQIAGLYTATGNEAFITIGNFLDDSQTDTVNMYPPGTTPYYIVPNAYIFVDAVSVFSINPTGNLPWSYRDTTIIIGDSVYIGNYMGGNFNPPNWYTISGSYLATKPGIYVKPATTSSYVVQYTVCGTPRADTVEVKVVTGTGLIANELKKMEFTVFPNPAQNEIQIEFVSETNFIKPKQIIITDVLGRVVKTISVQNRKQNISIAELNSGCYNLQFQNEQGLKITKKLVKE
jgi:hypothetical protein